MSVAAVIRRGYVGPASGLITRGYSIGEAVISQPVGGGKRARWTYIDRDITEYLEPEPKKERIRVKKSPSREQPEKAFDLIRKPSVDYDAKPLLDAAGRILDVLQPIGAVSMADTTQSVSQGGFRAVEIIAARRKEEDALLLLLMEP